ncbi:MAG: hypothetical protein SOW62_01540 [Sodaliphilus sp.]|nr:hypothetical protein [Sodaliphilus sp.]
MTDIQYGIKIMGGREVSRPYRFFSPKASGFYPFGDATALAGEGGVGDVVWLIQASASNHKPKGRFFWYAFGIYKPKEPSLWFVISLVCDLRLRLESGTPHHQRRPPQRGRWHRQKDKNRSPSAKNKPGRDVILHVRP